MSAETMRIEALAQKMADAAVESLREAGCSRSDSINTCLVLAQLLIPTCLGNLQLAGWSRGAINAVRAALMVRLDAAIDDALSAEQFSPKEGKLIQ